jgi:hypothetical protein
LFKNIFLKFLLPLLASTLFLLNSNSALTQNIGYESWFGYMGSVKLSEKWKIWHDYHWVTQRFVVLRPGITYQTSKNYNISAGYAHLLIATPVSSSLRRKENRLWWQVVKTYPLNQRFSYNFRFRYDARFMQVLDKNQFLIENEFAFTNRYRLRQYARYKLNSNNNFIWHLTYMNEILVKSGKYTSFGFDQIRNYLLLGNTTPNISILFGYHLRHIPTVQKKCNQFGGLTFWVIHKIDLN